MKSFTNYTSTSFIKRLSSTDKFEAIKELAAVFKGSDICRDNDALVAALIEREKIMSTGIGVNIAVPHARINEVENIAFALGTSAEGIDFDSIDGQKVHIVILVAAGDDQHKNYLSLLSGIMAALKMDGVKEAIIDSNSSEDIYNILRESEKSRENK